MKQVGIFLVGVLSFFMAEANNHLAIKATKIYTVAGAVIDQGVILIKDNVIEAVGHNLKIPQGYKIHDYKEGFAYPGLINPYTRLGVSSTGSLSVLQDSKEIGKYNPQLSVFTAFYPWSNLIPITRNFGTTMVMTVPSGGIISGKATLVNLSGWSPADMIMKKECALIIKIPTELKKGKNTTQISSKERQKLTDFFQKSYRFYLQTQNNQKTKFDPKYAAMLDLWRKPLPVIAHADNPKEIKFSIKLAKEFKFNLVLFGVYDAEAAIKEIKDSGYPVILPSILSNNREWEDGYDKYCRLPAILAKAGIKFSFSVSYASGMFNLPQNAGRSVAFGLSPQEALKALTLYPAQILGIPQYGSLAPGKRATIIIADGNILENSTRILQVFINGQRMTEKSYFIREYERARTKTHGE